MIERLVPAALRPGDRVAVVAPSSPFEHLPVWRGLGFLHERYRVVFRRDLFSRAGYLAGDDARRTAELEAALDDDEVRAVFAARGGYGANRFVHALDWSKLRRSPKWIVGFSDITALHLEASRVGVASLHAPHVNALGRSDARCRNEVIDALESPQRVRTYDGLESVMPGTASGPLVGGNLTLLHACAAAGRLAIPPGAILFLEDVTERPYRIDRMLTTLELGGHFDAVSGFVLGDFTDCDPGKDKVTVDDVLRARLTPRGVPIVAKLASGHGLRNRPLCFGRTAIVGDGTLRV